MDKTVFDFLHTLKENNNRDWFNDHKKQYELARAEVEQFVDQLISKVQLLDLRIKNLTAKETMFRIYRDIRFSKDKTPYKTFFGAYFAPGGRKSTQAGYYMHISPDECFIGGGSHNPMGESVKKIRSEIYYNAPEFRSILDNKKFKSLFGEVKGEKLKRPPKGYPADFDEIELLKLKTFTVFKIFNEDEVVSPLFEKTVIDTFKTMSPFIEFLNRGLDG